MAARNLLLRLHPGRCADGDITLRLQGLFGLTDKEIPEARSLDTPHTVGEISALVRSLKPEMCWKLPLRAWVNLRLGTKSGIALRFRVSRAGAQDNPWPRLTRWSWGRTLLRLYGGLRPAAP